MSKIQKVLAGAIALLVIIQFFRPEKNVSAATSPNDLFAHYQAPDSLKQMIRTSCYDCHSNNTAYPWYSNFQPIAWWLNDHVEEGKREFNFSEFATYVPKKADHKLKELIEVVKEQEMPLKSYTLIHSESRLTENQRRVLADWAADIRKEIQPKIKE
jgi:hypothetical protein